MAVVLRPGCLYHPLLPLFVNMYSMPRVWSQITINLLVAIKPSKFSLLISSSNWLQAWHLRSFIYCWCNVNPFIFQAYTGISAALTMLAPYYLLEDSLPLLCAFLQVNNWARARGDHSEINFNNRFWKLGLHVARQIQCTKNCLVSLCYANHL